MFASALNYDTMFPSAKLATQILTLTGAWGVNRALIAGETAAAILYMWEGVLEGEVITPAVLGTGFLSPFAGGGAGGATLCNYQTSS